MAARVVSKMAGVVLVAATLGMAWGVSDAATTPQLQAPALLHGVDGSFKELPKTINTLDLVAKADLESGVDIKVWRYATKYGEGSCDQGGQVGLDATTCPRFGLMISTRWEMEGNSKFALWVADPRRWWRLPDSTVQSSPDAFQESGGVGSLTLYACEASTAVDTGKVDPSSADNWHVVPYRLTIGPYNKARLERLPDIGPQKNCWRDDKAPVLSAGTGHQG